MENTTNNQEVIPVSGFNGIHFKSVGKVMLSQGDTDGLTIQADPEVRARIHTEVKDGILWITQETDWKDWTGFRLIDKGMTTYSCDHEGYQIDTISGRWHSGLC